jgi:hypothetical protein
MSISVKNGGTWSPVSEFHVKDEGVWKKAKGVWIKSGGVWEQVLDEETPVGPPEPIFHHDNISVEYAMHWQDTDGDIINTAENGSSDWDGKIELSGTVVDSDKFIKDFFSGSNGRIRINNFSPDFIGRTLNFWVKIDPLDTGIIHEIVKGDRLSIEFDPTVSPEVWRVKIETSVENTAEFEHTTTGGSWEMISVIFGNTNEVIGIYIGETSLGEIAYEKSGAVDQEITIGNSANCYVSRFRYFAAVLAGATISELWNGGNGV